VTSQRHIASTAIRTSSIPLEYAHKSFLLQSSNRKKEFQVQKCYFSSNSGSWNWNKSTTVTSATTSTSSKTQTKEDEEKVTITPSVQNQIMEKCASLHASIMPLNQKLIGPLAKNSDKGTSLPFVFLVGNHSSGKSSFINYVLGRDVQTAGVAPTDDCFTVVAPGPEDTDQDGPALIGDPDMGFEALRQFGPTLIHHTQLKVRKETNSPGFMMIDSPGMIDSPVSQSGMPQGMNLDKSMDRGYDFQGVVRWFAERADVVLLFFDPDKPGTTGETLNVLLHSLGGMDHKLLIVLNKADQFKKIHDFARAYGSLCWNLSKVIPRKDLPRIFTMCLPNKTEGAENDSIGAGLHDLHQSRDDVVAEVMKAPKRRVDNVITHLNDSVHLLLMHAQIARDVQKKYSKMVWENRIQELGSLTTGIGLTSLAVYAQLPLEFSGAAVAITTLGVGGLKWFNGSKLTEAENKLVSMEELSASFQRTHAREISEADEFTASVWQRIRHNVQLSLKSEGLDRYPTVSNSDLESLRSILDDDIPDLRRMGSPQHFGSKSFFG
jgi:hypothetical protein